MARRGFGKRITASAIAVTALLPASGKAASGANEATTKLASIADLSITKSDSSDPVDAASAYSYTLQVSNDGPSAASSLWVIDRLPAGVGFVGASGTGWTCNVDGRVVICTLALLEYVGPAPPITVDVTAPLAAGQVTNDVTVSAAEMDPDMSNNSASETTQVTAEAADLSITKSDSADPVDAGSAFSYTLQVRNFGPAEATSVSVEDTLPAGVGFVSASGAGWTCGEAGGVVTCARAALAVGAAPPITVDVTAPAAGEAITNVASVSAAEVDSDALNDRASELTRLTAMADLSLAVIDDPDPASAGAALTYTLTVVNGGPSAAEDVAVTAPLPPGVTLVSTTGCAADPAAVPVCNLGTLAAGASRDYSVELTVDPHTAGTLVYDARVTSSTPEGHPGDESAGATTTVPGEADLAVALAAPRRAVPGRDLTYRVTVTNGGPGNVLGARLASDLSSKLGAAVRSCSGTAGSSCVKVNPAADFADTFDLPAGGTLTWEITAAVLPGASGTLTSALAVSPPPGVVDPDPADDGASADVLLEPRAALSVTVDDGRDTAIPGKGLTYVVTVANAGPSDAPDAELGVAIAGELEDVVWTCTPTGRAVACPSAAGAGSPEELVHLDAGGGYVYEVSATVAADAAGALTTGASVSAPVGVVDPDPADNADSDVDALDAGQLVLSAASFRLGEGANPEIAFESPDEAVIVWQRSTEQEGGIFARQVKRSGEPLGLEMRVSLDAPVPQVNPDVAFDDETERYLAVWNEGGDSGSSGRVTGRFLARGGEPLGFELQVSQRASADEVRPAVSAGPDGFVVVWKSAADPSGTEGGVFAQLVRSGGEPLGIDLRIDSGGGTAGSAALTRGPDDDFVATWNRNTAEQGSIVARKVSRGGEPLGFELGLSSVEGSMSAPDVVFDAETESFFVAWRREPADGESSLVGRKLARGGEPLGVELTLNAASPAPGADREPRLAGAAGELVVVWERASDAAEVDGGIFGKRVATSGEPLDLELRLGSSSGSNERQPAIAAAPPAGDEAAGEFLLAWGASFEAEREEIEAAGLLVAADLAMEVTATPDPLLDGGTVTYAITVTNPGPADAVAAALDTVLPAEAALLASRGCAEDPVGSPRCTLGTLTAGSSVGIDLEVAVAPGAKGVLELAFSVSSLTPDPDLSDNVVAHRLALSVADLEARVTEAPDRTLPGETVRYRVAVTNAGPSIAEDVTVAVAPDAAVSLVSSSGCAEDPAGVPECTLGQLEAGASREITLTFRVGGDAAGALRHRVRAAALTEDPLPDDNAATVSTPIGQAELGLTVDDAPDPVTAGQELTYTVTVTNSGSAAASDVVLEGSLDEPLRPLATSGCAEDPAGVPVCGLGTIPAGASRRATLRAAVAAAASGTLRQTFTLESPSTAGSLGATVETTVAPSDELVLQDGRFVVRVDWRHQRGAGGSGPGRAVPYSDTTGFFWFFGPENVELLVSVFDGRPVNDHFWVFYGPLTDVEFDLTVTDRATGAERVYHSPPGALCGRGDTTAFPDATGASIGGRALRAPGPRHGDRGTPDSGASGACVAGAETLCLQDGRFRVEVRWANQGVEGGGRAVAGTGDTGYFWFFDRQALDLAVKVLDGRPLNGSFWVFYAGLTHVEYRILITDTETGATKSFVNPAGQICGGVDTEAFSF